MAPSYNLDLSGYRPMVSDTVPDGRYLAMVEDYDFSKSKSGNDMFTIWVRIVTGPQAGNIIIDRLVTQGKGLFKIVGFMNGLGLPTPKRRLSVNPEQWKNRKVYIDTGMSEPYRGRPATSQIEGYTRYVVEDETTTEAVVDGPTVEVQAYGEGALGEAIEVEDVMAFETAPAEVVDASQGDESATPSVADRVKAASAPVAVPASAEPEMLSLSDISL